MTKPQDLVTTLKAQHRMLQADLSQALTDATSGTGGKGAAIVTALAKFKTDLLEHLTLENGEFYPDYLEKKMKRGEDVTGTKEFIRQMDDIGKAVMGFLDKYTTAEAIDVSLPTFREELPGIIKTLNVRIETEEDGVYGIYLLM